MRKLILFVAVMMMGSFAWGQNWSTVRLNDTVYFANDWNGKKRLKTIWIESFTNTGSDTTFSFYKSYRYLGQPCLDTMAASWLGSKYIHLQDGTEYYFNSNDDTIKILTQAQVGDSWTIAHSGNKTFIATMSSYYLTQVDGVNDAAKKFSIQAYQNGNPVQHWFNGKEFIISKEHGWLQTFDLFSFPNILATGGVQTDSVEHYRLKHSFNNINLKDANPLSRYAVGNEWISSKVWQTEPGVFPNPPYDTKWEHDSVMSVQTFSNGLVATIKTEVVTKLLFQSPTYTAYSHSDSIVSQSTFTLKDTVLPEYYQDVTRFPFISPFMIITASDYFVDTICYGLHFSLDIVSGYNFFWKDTNNCYKNGPIPTLFYYPQQKWKYLDGFGIAYHYYYNCSGDPIYAYEETTYPYIKIGDCEIGTKVDVHSLGINEIPTSSISISPNPTKDIITIKGITEPTIAVYNLMGQKVVTTQGSNEVNLAHLPVGMYMVEVFNKHMELVKSEKVIKE